MFGFLKKRAEAKRKQEELVQAGRQAGADMIKAVDAFLDAGTAHLAGSILQVFADRLGTIHDEKSQPPEAIARVELNIFLDHMKNFEPKLREEAELHLRNWLELAAQLGVVDGINAYIDRKIANAHAAVTAKALEMTGEAIGQPATTRSP